MEGRLSCADRRKLVHDENRQHEKNENDSGHDRVDQALDPGGAVIIEMFAVASLIEKLWCAEQPLQFFSNGLHKRGCPTYPNQAAVELVDGRFNPSIKASPLATGTKCHNIFFAFDVVLLLFDEVFFVKENVADASIIAF